MPASDASVCTTHCVEVTEENAAELRSLLSLALTLEVGATVCVEFDMLRSKVVTAARLVVTPPPGDEGTEERGEERHDLTISVAMVALVREEFNNIDARKVDVDASLKQSGELLDEGEGDDTAAAAVVRPAPRTQVKAKPRPRTPKASSDVGTDDEEEVLAAYKNAAKPTLAFLAVLEENSLDSFADPLRKVGITSSKTLLAHTLEELEDALRAAGGKGKSFKMSAAFKRVFRPLCAADPADPVPATGGADGGAAGGYESRVASLVTAAVSQVKTGSATVANVEYEDDVNTSDDDAPQAQPPIARKKASAVADATSRPLMLGLFGDVQLSLDVICLSAESVGDLLDRPAFPRGQPQNVPSASDRLELLLEVASEGGALPDMASAPKGQPRATLKWLEKLALTKGAPSKPKGGAGEHESMVLSTASAVLEASGSGKVSEADRKIVEELVASRKRLEMAAGDPVAVRAVTALAKAMQGDASADDKIAMWSETVNANAAAAELLYSAHVREPTGARSLEKPGLRELAERARDARNGLLHAGRAQMRDMLPPHSEVMVLVEAAFKGELASKAGSKLNVRELANPKAAKPWLGVAAGSGTKASAAESEQNALITLSTVWPTLVHALQAMHPLDGSISATMAVVNAEIAKGLKRNGVAAAVESVLAPLLRELEEAWDAFQKSASAPLPVMRSIWTSVRASGSVAGYIAQAAAPVVPSPAAPPATDLAALRATLLKEVRRDIKRAVAQGGYSSGLDEKPDGAGENWEQNRKKRDAKKERDRQSKAKAKAEKAKADAEDDAE